jgi:hypothetical protein
MIHAVEPSALIIRDLHFQHVFAETMDLSEFLEADSTC